MRPGLLDPLVPRSRRGRGALVGVLLAFVLVRVAENGGAAPGWVVAWADDLLCLPLVLTLALAGHRLCGGSAAWTLPAAHGLLLVAVYAVLFEVLLPAVDRRATADPLDVLAYLAGWLIFQLLLNLPGGTAPAPATATCAPGCSARS